MTTFPHIRVQAQGELGASGGNEIWSCGLKIGITADVDGTVLLAPTQADVDEISVAMATRWHDFLTSGSPTNYQGVFCDSVGLVGVNVAAVIANTHDDPALHSTFTPAPLYSRGLYGAASGLASPAGQTPYNVAVVATLKGDIYPKGSASHGRMYLPCPNLHSVASGAGFTPMVDGLMGVATVTNLSSATAGFIAATNLAIADLISGRHAVVCNIGASEDLAGLRWQPITKVVVDNRPDTMRSRYNKLSGRGKITTVTF